MKAKFSTAFRKGAEQRRHGARRMNTMYAATKAAIAINTNPLSRVLRLAQIAITNETKTIGQRRL
jgi:phosphopantothenate synthetase